jgi:hypothetical protein
VLLGIRGTGFQVGGRYSPRLDTYVAVGWSTGPHQLPRSAGGRGGKQEKERTGRQGVTVEDGRVGGAQTHGKGRRRGLATDLRRRGSGSRRRRCEQGDGCSERQRRICKGCAEREPQEDARQPAFNDAQVEWAFPLGLVRALETVACMGDVARIELQGQDGNVRVSRRMHAGKNRAQDAQLGGEDMTPPRQAVFVVGIYLR